MNTPFAKSAATASIRQARSTLPVASKLIAAVAGSLWSEFRPRPKARS
jgi:hypothetical protein